MCQGLEILWQRPNLKVLLPPPSLAKGKRVYHKMDTKASSSNEQATVAVIQFPVPLAPQREPFLLESILDDRNLRTRSVTVQSAAAIAAA